MKVREFFHRESPLTHYIAAPQLAAIRQGLIEIIPAPILNLCVWEDLQRSVCGYPFIDIQVLKVKANATHHTTPHTLQHNTTFLSHRSPSAPHDL